MNTTSDHDKLIEMIDQYKEKAAKPGHKIRIIYNRVPKCGSRAVIGVFMALAGKRNYSYKHSRVFSHRNMTVEEQV